MASERMAMENEESKPILDLTKKPAGGPPKRRRKPKKRKKARPGGALLKGHTQTSENRPHVDTPPDAHLDF